MPRNFEDAEYPGDGLTTKSAGLQAETRRTSAEMTDSRWIPEFQLSLVSVAGIQSRQISATNLYAIQISQAR